MGLDPGGKPYRFTVLLFVSLILYGSYFAYDSLGAIAPLLIQAFGVGRGAVGLTYTLYSIAAILSVLIGGMLIDWIGTRKASLLFSSLVTLGALIVALAPNMSWIYVGRFIFGAGSESLVVAQSAILARWFKGKELALAFGLALTISRLGTLFSFNTEALISDYFGNFRYALWAAVALCLFSLLCNGVYVLLDQRGARVLNLPEPGAEEKIVLKDIRRFPPSYWYVVLLCVTFYSAIFPFTSLSTDLFHDKWHLPLTSGTEGGFLTQVFGSFLHMFTTAGGVTSIIIFASMVFAPFAGGLVDRIGKRATLMILGSLFMIPAHLTMGVTHLYPVYPMIVLGAAFVLVPAAMWPSVPLIVEESRVGTAFGFMTMIQNMGLALFPYLNGLLRDITKTYTASMVMFASLGTFGLIFALLLKKADKKEGGRLERSGS